MINENAQKDAFGLFEKGRYAECLNIIHAIGTFQREGPLRILEAVCLFETGLYEEAERCLRDLRICVPDSSEVCLYLGRILQVRGDDEARYAYSEAVRLDPDNPEGLRWYAEYVMDQNDYPAAIPVLTRLYTISGDTQDLSRLMQAFRKNKKPEYAVQAYLGNGSPSCCRIEYFSALVEAGRNSEILSEIKNPADCPDEEFTILITSLEQESPEKSDACILPHIMSGCSKAAISAYIRLLIVQNRLKEAVGVWSTYLQNNPDPDYQVLIVPALAGLGDMTKAGELLENVLYPDPPPADTDKILSWLNLYRDIILEEGRDTQALIHKAGSVLHPAYLACAGLWSEDEGNYESARMYFQKAFRSDIVHGGLWYASHLERNSDLREWEKTITYILKNTRKIRDIELVTDTMFPKITRNLSLLKFFHGKLENLLVLLTSKGKSYYCNIAGILASEELSAGRYSQGMNLCLNALAEVPTHDIRTAEYLFSILMACKKPGLPMDYSRRDNTEKSKTTDKGPLISDLTPVEEAAYHYIRRHRVCSELDLRPICGTRRIAGLMNRLIRKISAEGWQIIMKDGMSESGEVYRYAGP